MDATVHTPLGRKDTNNIAIFQMFKTKTHTDLTDPTDFTTTGILLNTTQTTWTTLFTSSEVKEVKVQ